MAKKRATANISLEAKSELDSVKPSGQSYDGIMVKLWKEKNKEYWARRKEQTGGRANWLSWAYLGDLTTNRNGNGNFDARILLSTGSHHLQIVVSYPWGSWGKYSFGTNIATITIK